MLEELIDTLILPNSDSDHNHSTFLELFDQRNRRRDVIRYAVSHDDHYLALFACLA